MATQQSPSKSALKTSLPSAFAAVNAEQPPAPYPLPSQEDQDKYLQGRPGATPRHLGIALQHAHQIQAQKDAEDMILDRTIELLAIPASPSADPAAPSAEEAQTFKSALVPFRPSDYDNLIMERNNEDLCGYGLCPRNHRKEDNPKGSAFRFKWGAKGSGPGGRGRTMDIVPREKIEKWCSDKCAERALFIRVQLAEEPVWERRADDTRATNLLLLEEARSKRQRRPGESSAPATSALQSSEADLTTEMKNLKIQDTERSRELALERGDTSASLRQGRIDVQIKENDHGPESSVVAPQMRPEDATGGSIEGYIPQERRDKNPADHDGDLLDQI
ncbi:uncharacterized protein N7459_009181 [Penicillium hispanicum]|uniref:uncharacterized protein n=1 Tax=Penicillium hispanicum TaxID=1080232 RepID=UPI00254180A2|nr:uncharacterized protein N7459_009181 [Penicillium hispanicum]KAJ5569751.1 hypothetical protein N7459_009181 [Penicillium hispanicum]